MSESPLIGLPEPQVFVLGGVDLGVPAVDQHGRPMPPIAELAPHRIGSGPLPFEIVMVFALASLGDAALREENEKLRGLVEGLDARLKELEKR